MAKPNWSWFLKRLEEPSTWRGIVLCASAAGVAIDPQQAAGIAALGTTVVGVIEVFRKESKSDEDQGAGSS